MINPKIKTAIIIAIAILPFGLVALGLWKAHELIKQKEADEKTNELK